MLCLMTDKPMASVNETDGRFETNLEPSPESWAASDHCYDFPAVSNVSRGVKSAYFHSKLMSTLP